MTDEDPVCAGWAAYRECLRTQTARIRKLLQAEASSGADQRLSDEQLLRIYDQAFTKAATGGGGVPHGYRQGRGSAVDVRDAYRLAGLAAVAAALRAEQGRVVTQEELEKSAATVGIHLVCERDARTRVLRRILEDLNVPVAPPEPELNPRCPACDQSSLRLVRVTELGSGEKWVAVCDNLGCRLEFGITAASQRDAIEAMNQLPRRHTGQEG